MKRELNWAVIGCGVIANELAHAFEKLDRKIYAVGNRTYEKAVAFAEKYGVTKVYENPHEVFEDEDVDVIYISTPHNTHIEYIRKALKNGKHVLAEKAITLNSMELEEALKLAEEKHVVLAEAMTIWHMPLYKKLWKMVNGAVENFSDETETGGKEIHGEKVCEKEAGGVSLGKVQMIQLNFGSYKEYDMKNRFFNMDLAGGALLDIGVYALSIARSFMISQPEQVLSQVKYAPTGADEQAGILLMNGDGQMATLALSLHSKQPKRAVISCEKGYIEIMEYPRADKAIIVEAETGKVHEVTAGTMEEALEYEVLDMEDAILNGNTSVMRLEQSRDVMAIMTQLRKEWGMKYPGEIW